MHQTLRHPLNNLYYYINLPPYDYITLLRITSITVFSFIPYVITLSLLKTTSITVFSFITYIITFIYVYVCTYTYIRMYVNMYIILLSNILFCLKTKCGLRSASRHVDLVFVDLVSVDLVFIQTGHPDQLFSCVLELILSYRGFFTFNVGYSWTFSAMES